ncbi:hypothetical protein HY497_01075 [Candidatus Woesearchaeota archaeon]|nr:hypothetical protein [Candidatus Woesearchaeota archaeon]
MASFRHHFIKGASALAILAALGGGTHFYFEHKTKELKDKLEQLEAGASGMQEDYTQMTAHVHAELAAVRASADETARTFEQRIASELSALGLRVDDIAAQTDVNAKLFNDADINYQKLTEAAQIIQQRAEKTQAEWRASLAEVVDGANQFIFEPEKHYAVLTPSGVRVFPIVSKYDFKEGAVSYCSYTIDDNLFDSSSSLVDVLLFLSHSAEQQPTARGRSVVHYQSGYKIITQLAKKGRGGPQAFLSALLDAAARDRPNFPSSQKFDEYWQFREAVHVKACRSGESRHRDLPLMYLDYVTEPLEFPQHKVNVHLVYESLALLGAETLCSEKAHQTAARGVFNLLFDCIERKKELGIGLYASFGGSTFDEKVRSLATLKRAELVEIAQDAKKSYGEK